MDPILDPESNQDSTFLTESDTDSDTDSDLDLELFQEPIRPTRMDVSQDSPRGTNFMPSSPPPDPARIEAWPKDLVDNYIEYLENSSNQGVLTGEKRATIRNHLRQLDGRPPAEYTTRQKQQFNNDKYLALKYYELQDNQVYRKASMVHGIRLNAQYCACIWDSFEIICKTHLQLHHFGKSPLFLQK
jgi:hypothetical protein